MGCVGAFGQGMGDQDIAFAFKTGKTWFEVPETMKINIKGSYDYPATAKDLTLFILKHMGAAGMLGKSVEYYGQLQADRKIESFELVGLESHGGDLNGFVLLRGEGAKLEEVRNEETFRNNSIEASYCIENFGVIKCAIGDALIELYAQWSKLL